MKYFKKFHEYIRKERKYTNGDYICSVILFTIIVLSNHGG